MATGREERLRLVLLHSEQLVAEIDALTLQPLSKLELQALVDESAHLRIAMKHITHAIDPDRPEHVCSPQPNAPVTE